MIGNQMIGGYDPRGYVIQSAVGGYIIRVGMLNYVFPSWEGVAKFITENELPMIDEKSLAQQDALAMGFGA